MSFGDDGRLSYATPVKAAYTGSPLHQRTPTTPVRINQSTVGPLDSELYAPFCSLQRQEQCRRKHCIGICSREVSDGRLESLESNTPVLVGSVLRLITARDPGNVSGRKSKHGVQNEIVRAGNPQKPAGRTSALLLTICQVLRKGPRESNIRRDLVGPDGKAVRVPEQHLPGD